MKEVKSKKNGHVVQTIDEKRKFIKYHLVPGTDQTKHFSYISVEGFTKLPSGFYADGYGLTRLGGYVLRALSEELGERFDLRFVKEGKSSISRRTRVPQVTFKHADYASLMDELKDIRTAKNLESNALSRTMLSAWFPSVFKKPKAAAPRAYSYEPDKIAKILHSEPQLIEKLSKNDITTLLEIYPTLVNKFTDSGRVAEKLLVVNKSKAAADRIVLKELIKEFERRLKKTTQSEGEWQRFLAEHILLFNTSYVASLGRTSVSLQGKYPDFMLVDVFNYVDIFEIKKPTTTLLQLDSSRNNHYWDSELSKGISQLENYINSLTTNSATFEKDARASKLDINVIRPRGVLIAGTREQLDSPKKRDDFRLLRNSLKNIDVILFDDFLERLKNLAKRLS